MNVTTVLRTHPLLDEDWNYNWVNITRSKLPTYIVKYYEAISKNMDGPIRILFNTMHENSSFIRFNLSQVNVNEKISDIELHFYYTVDEELLEKSLILRMYQVNSSLLNDNSSIVNPDAHKLLNVIYILQAENGWQVCHLILLFIILFLLFHLSRYFKLNVHYISLTSLIKFYRYAKQEIILKV